MKYIHTYMYIYTYKHINLWTWEASLKIASEARATTSDSGAIRIACNTRSCREFTLKFGSVPFSIVMTHIFTNIIRFDNKSRSSVKNQNETYFIAGQPAPAPHRARPEESAVLQICRPVYEDLQVMSLNV